MIKFMRCGRTLAPLLLLAAAAMGCSNAGQNEVAGKATIYPMRGVIEKLPTPGADEELFIHHEALEKFIDPSGKASTMGSMTMPFELAKGVSLDGFKVGDKIDFQWSVCWKPSNSEILKIAKLPPETELHFGKMKSMPNPPGAPAFTASGAATTGNSTATLTR